MNAPDPAGSRLAEDVAGARAVLEVVRSHLEAGVAERIRTAVSGWTVGQQLAHVCLVASSIATALQRLMRKGGGEGASTPATRELLRAGVLPRGVATAPTSLTRPVPPPEVEIWTALAKARRRWHDLAAQQADLEAARGSLPHPLLGPLAAGEWVRFAVVHGRHHLSLVDEILADSARLPGPSLGSILGGHSPPSSYCSAVERYTEGVAQDAGGARPHLHHHRPLVA